MYVASRWGLGIRAVSEPSIASGHNQVACTPAERGEAMDQIQFVPESHVTMQLGLNTAGAVG